MKIKKLYWTALAALSALPVTMLAQEQSASGPVSASGSGWGTTFTVGDVTAVDNAASGIQSIMEKILASLVKPVGIVLIAGIALWAMPHIVGIIKSAFSRGKGR